MPNWLADAVLVLLVAVMVATAYVGRRISKIEPYAARRSAAWKWCALGTALIWAVWTARDFVSALAAGGVFKDVLPLLLPLSGLNLVVTGTLCFALGATQGLWTDAKPERSALP